MVRPLAVFRNLRARLALLRSMDIGPTDVVLEVGSGQNPNPRADILCDRFLFDDTERNEQPVRIDRPFVAGDIYRLPFGDQAFDYVICAHVLEHLEDPEAAARELGRVAARGFLEVPSRVNEKILGFPFHRWMIDREGDTLVFEPKDRPIWDPELRAWLERLSELFPGFEDRFMNHLGELGNVHRIVWEGAPRVRVLGDGVSDDVSFAGQGEIGDAVPMSDGEPAAPSWKEHVTSALARLLRRRSTARLDLADRLRCPNCAGRIDMDRAEARCGGPCRRAYPVRHLAGRSVPLLLRELGRTE